MNLPSESSSKPNASGRLLAAALSGLLGVGAATACGVDVKTPTDSTDGTGGSGGRDGGAPPVAAGGASPSQPDGGGAGGATDTYNNQISGDAGGMTLKSFQALCEERGGFVYRNSACAGSSMCKGLSLHDGVLWDHSCRGQNSTCAGIGCLDMPEDKGLSGKEIYENGPCSGCHADWSKVVDYDKDKPDYSKYALFYDPALMTRDEVTKRFKNSTDARLLAIVAWGTQGLSDNYIPYSNMPTYYQKYSLAELKRLVEHVKSLTAFTYPAPQFGAPDAGVGGPSMDPDGGAPP